MQIKSKKLVKHLETLRKQHSAVFLLASLSVFFAMGILAATYIRSSQIDTNLATNQRKHRAEIDKIKQQYAIKRIVAASSKLATQSPQNTESSTIVANQNEANNTGGQQTQSAETKPATPKPVESPKPTNTPTTPKPSAPDPAPAASYPAETASSLAFINSVRAAAGKPPLTQNGTMNQWALSHTQAQTSACKIYHQNLSGFLSANIGPVTTTGIAENVGYHSTIDGVLNGLKNSPGHYANMTGDYTYVGIGVVTVSSGGCAGYVYTTQLFAK